MLTALPNESAEGAIVGRTPSLFFYPADLLCSCRRRGHENPDNPFLQSIVVVLEAHSRKLEGWDYYRFSPSVLPRPKPH